MMQEEKNMDPNNLSDRFYNIPFKIEIFNDMPFRALGSSGLRVPNIGLGTWKMGYPNTGDGSRVNEEETFKIFDRAIELGVTFWDTANRYNNASGNSERVIGRWLQNNPDQRRNVILSSKLGGCMDGLTPNHCGLSRTNIIDSVNASLDRLHVSHIDILYFHLFDPLVPIEESLMAIEDLIRMDVIRYFAISNFTVEQIKLYKKIEKKFSVRSRIVAIQNQFDVIGGERKPYEGVLNYAFEERISFIAWSPLSKGLLTQRYLNQKAIGPGDRLFDEGKIKNDSNIPGIKKIHKLAELSAEWGLKLNELVISYMLTLPSMGPVISSSTSVSQLSSNASAGKIILNDQQKKRIEQVISV
jgi:1-deoxyxylulose-5-phosphate synthase